MFKKLCVVLLVWQSALFSYNKLILHFDVNKTLIAFDSVKGQSPADALAALPPEAARKLCCSKSAVFPSFYRLLQYLNHQQIAYTIVLRTFGSDLAVVVPEINSYIKPDAFCEQGFYKRGYFYFKGTSYDMQEAYKFIKGARFVAIRDDYQEWKASSHGKRLMIDTHDPETLSLFFDDHVREVVTAVDLQGNSLSASSSLVAVDTVEAIVNECYYIDLVKEKLLLK